MMPAATELELAASRPRIEAVRYDALDRLRGLAVVLMVCDHVLAVLPALAMEQGRPWPRIVAESAIFVRLTVTRLALPVFAGVSGFVLARRDGPSVRRRLQIVAAACFSQVAFTSLPGLSDVDVLVVFALALAVWPIVRRHPVPAVAIGVVVAFNLPPFPNGLTGYHPALIVAFMALGALARRADASMSWQERLPSGLARLGRHPLAAYIAHLLLLWLAVAPAS